MSDLLWIFSFLLWFGLSNGPSLIGLLVGILTYVPFVGVDYKVIDADHIMLLCCLVVGG